MVEGFRLSPHRFKKLKKFNVIACKQNGGGVNDLKIARRSLLEFFYAVFSIYNHNSETSGGSPFHYCLSINY